jgi:hypothetical protein
VQNSFRHDIEGLRALAVLPIVLFHLDPRLAPGGYMGVDIFFVISGYLITQMILRDEEGFRFKAFYIRRFFRLFPALLVTLLSGLTAGCSSQSPGVGQGDTAQPPPTLDAATRSTPAVVGRPSRVFVFAGFGKNCEPVAEPKIAVVAPPAKGDVSLQPGQETTIMSSVQGSCIGTKARGTGVYYTPRPGSAGTTDRFTVTATLATGETSTRTFDVRITE